MKTFKVLPLIVSTAFFLFILNGCKKTDQGTQTADVSKNDLVDKLKETLKNNPQAMQVVVPLNEKVISTWTDLTGNKIIANNTNRVIDCNGLDDVDYPPYETLISVGAEYDCSRGYRYTFNWNISSPVKLYAVSPLNGSSSKGRVRLKNVSGTLTYTDLNITPVTIIYIGDDPTTSNSNGLYKASFTSQWISAAINKNQLLSNSIVVYTDCATLPSVTSAYTANTPIYVNLSNPLTRIDPVFFQSASNVARGILLGFGNGITANGCISPGAGNFADRQMVQIMYTGDKTNTWKTISPLEGKPITTAGNLYPFTTGILPRSNPVIFNKNQNGSIGLYDAYYIPDRDMYFPILSSTPSRGNYLIRWCNEMTPIFPGVNSFGPFSATYTIVL